MVFILFILLLSVIIIVHEFGHLIAAKIFGVYCHEFSMGMGPQIFKYQGKETTYSLRAIPIGGFVAMAGDSDNTLETKVDFEVPKNRTLIGISAWKKIIIMLAGIIMNFVLALLAASFVFLNNGFYNAASDTTIAKIANDSPAYHAGLKVDDKIVRLSYEDLNISTKPKTFDDLSYFTFGNEAHELTIDVLRDGEIKTIKLYETYDENKDQYFLGISAYPYQTIKVNIFNFLSVGFTFLIQMTRTIFMSLSQLIRGIGLNNLSGPVGIYNATSEAVNYGIKSYLLMIAMLSLNVGIFNALPLPILDGGRVVITIIEKIIGKAINEKILNFIMSVSVILVILLMVFATMQDIIRLF